MRVEISRRINSCNIRDLPRSSPHVLHFNSLVQLTYKIRIFNEVTVIVNHILTQHEREIGVHTEAFPIETRTETA